MNLGATSVNLGKQIQGIGDKVGIPNNRGLSAEWVLRERVLHLRRADAVARDVEHVIDAASDPDEAILIPPRTVTAEVVPLHTETVANQRNIVGDRRTKIAMASTTATWQMRAKRRIEPARFASHGMDIYAALMHCQAYKSSALVDDEKCTLEEGHLHRETMDSSCVGHSMAEDSQFRAPQVTVCTGTPLAWGAQQRMSTGCARLEGREVGLLVALVVVVQVAEHGRPGALDGQDALRRPLDLLALLRQQHGLHPEEWQRRTARLRWPHACRRVMMQMLSEHRKGQAEAKLWRRRAPKAVDRCRPIHVDGLIPAATQGKQWRKRAWSRANTALQSFSSICGREHAHATRDP